MLGSLFLPLLSEGRRKRSLAKQDRRQGKIFNRTDVRFLDILSKSL